MDYRVTQYNSDNKPIHVTNPQGETTAFSYGSSGNRYKQVVTNTTGSKRTIYYVAGGYELTIENNQQTSRAYLDNYGLIKRGDDGVELYYLHTDRLGSIDAISDGQGNTNDSVSSLRQEMRRYNVFGKASVHGQDSNNGLVSNISSRGFTGHEHLTDYSLIHMNGRGYDPDIGRFISVDPFIALPDE